MLCGIRKLSHLEIIFNVKELQLPWKLSVSLVFIYYVYIFMNIHIYTLQKQLQCKRLVMD